MGVVLKFGRAQARVQNPGYASEQTAVVVNDIVRFFGVLWRCRFASYKNEGGIYTDGNSATSVTKKFLFCSCSRRVGRRCRYAQR